MTRDSGAIPYQFNQKYKYRMNGNNRFRRLGGLVYTLSDKE